MRFLLALMAVTLFAISSGCDKPEDTKPAAGDSASATTAPEAPEVPEAPAGESQTVSLKLPGMTGGGCVTSVRDALESVDGIADIKLDKNTTSGSFTAPANLDVEKTLNDLVSGGNKHLKDWSKVE